MAKYWILLLFLSFISLFNCIYSFVQCEQKNVNVKLTSIGSVPTGPDYSIATWFCSKQGVSLDENKVVHVTIHGYSYDHNYWDFPYGTSKNYSYINYVIERSNGNIVILNIDRIGIGLSDKPPGTSITISTDAFVIYQLTQKLSTGVYSNINFKKIILVGHSLGTLITLHVAGNNDLNQHISGIIPTGLLHQLNPVTFILFPIIFYSAILDPKFINAGLPLDYFTTKPGYTTRQKLFYNINNADINLIQLDEQLKQTGTSGEAVTLFPQLLPAFIPVFDEELLSQLLLQYLPNLVSITTPPVPNRIPALLVMGQFDILLCNASVINLPCNNPEDIKNREILFYNGMVEAYVLENSGHDINLHLNAQDWFEQAFNWTQRHFSI